ncbi:Uncharacterised protein [Vibrio cholerae]|nr:Uncharacterised protein [Vibrio cholerae]CSB72723.1 Uncharacterised protein [Vibrio cholerae]CSB81009.1 Uncharacterised protein [Vibrio cholerae]CSH81798.1 Uncharacterised protein [Vibrio cholerae]
MLGKNLDKLQKVRVFKSAHDTVTLAHQQQDRVYLTSIHRQGLDPYRIKHPHARG